MDFLGFDVREFDLRNEYLEKFVKYLEGRHSFYHWVILFHDKNGSCAGVCGDLYYHVIVWFKQYSQNGKKQYFSNIPLMQWVRRMYRSNGNMVYPNVLCYGDIELRIDRLISSGHIYLSNMSFPHPSVYDILLKRHVV